MTLPRAAAAEFSLLSRLANPHPNRQTTPNGKVLLKNISLGIYLGAKIGILGAWFRAEAVRGSWCSSICARLRARAGCPASQLPSHRNFLFPTAVTSIHLQAQTAPASRPS